MSEIKIHTLKTHVLPFDDVWEGLKPYEVRHNDRGFKVGDYLFLREYLHNNDQYTGRAMMVVVTYITPGGKWGLPEGVCVMAVKVIDKVVGDMHVDVC